MSNYELQSHKKSDSIKWIIVFTLIAVLFVGLIVSFVRGNNQELPEEIPSEQSLEIEGQQLFDGEFQEGNFIDILEE